MSLFPKVRELLSHIEWQKLFSWVQFPEKLLQGLLYLFLLYIFCLGVIQFVKKICIKLPQKIMTVVLFFILVYLIFFAN